MGRKLNTEIFINRAEKIHKDKYDYSLIEYKNAHTKVKIICSKHGEFLQTSYKHLNGEGCGICAGNTKLTNEEFIIKSKNKHGDKYNYSLVKYNGNKNKVILICKYHGEFEQTAGSHLSGNGCSSCFGNKIINTNIFIKKSKVIHDNKYNYDKVNYINSETKIIINCKLHGDFEQRPDAHLKGHGCKNCVGLNTSSTEEFIKKSIKIHGDKYNYSKVNYINAYTKVVINCKKHGDFEQAPTHHLDGQNCKVCNSSKGEVKIEQILKENNIKYKTQYWFKDLKYKQYLKFDFCILDKNDNIQYLLEYNGIQHYEYVKYLHKNENNYKIAQHRDQLKKDYCINKNIPLYIIKYNEEIVKNKIIFN